MGLGLSCLFLTSTVSAADNSHAPGPLRPGQQVRVRLTGGQQFRAGYVTSSDEHIVLTVPEGQLRLPRTRIVQLTPVENISSPPAGDSTAPNNIRIEADSGTVPPLGSRSVQTAVAQLISSGQPGKALQLIADELAPQSRALAWSLAARSLAKVGSEDPPEPANNLTSATLRTDAELLVESLARFSTMTDPGQFTVACHHAANWFTRRNQSEPLSRLARQLDPINADGAARIHHLREFLDRQAKIAPGDWMAAYRLGRWAIERNLEPQARALFKLTANHPDIGPNARLQLEILNRRAALAAIEEIRLKATEGSDAEFRMALEDFRNRFPDSPYEGHLWQISEIRRVSQRQRAASNALTGAAAIQNLERLQNQGDHSAVIIAAQKIRAENPGSELAHHAYRYELRSRLALGTGTTENSANAKEAGPTNPTPANSIPDSESGPNDNLTAEERRLRAIDAMARQAVIEANRQMSH